MHPKHMEPALFLFHLFCLFPPHVRVSPSKHFTFASFPIWFSLCGPFPIFSCGYPPEKILHHRLDAACRVETPDGPRCFLSLLNILNSLSHIFCIGGSVSIACYDWMQYLESIDLIPPLRPKWSLSIFYKLHTYFC